MTPNATPVIFVDANILIAASVSRTGASRVVVALAEYGLIHLVVTRQVLDEVERNTRLKLPHILPFFAEMLSYLDIDILDDPERAAFERWIDIIGEKDAPILEAAVSASVDYFLTLNTKHFTADVAAASGLTIQTPGEFVRQIRHILSMDL